MAEPKLLGSKGRVLFLRRYLEEHTDDDHFITTEELIRLYPGMTLAIEPMIDAGTWEVEILEDEWTCVTADGSKSAHYENTVLITDGDPEILTLYRDGREV